MTQRADDAMQDVAAELALWDGKNSVPRKLAAEHFFQLKLLDFALELLRSLFRSTLEFLDLPLHGADGLLLFHNLQLQLFFRLFSGLVPCPRQIVLHPFFDGQLHLTPGVFQFPFSAKYFDLGFLRLGEFDIPLSQDFLKLGDFLNSLLKVIAKSQLGFFLFLCGDSSPFLLEFLIYLLVESFFGSL